MPSIHLQFQHMQRRLAQLKSLQVNVCVSCGKRGIEITWCLLTAHTSENSYSTGQRAQIRTLCAYTTRTKRKSRIYITLTMLLFLACIIGRFLKLNSKVRHRLSSSVRLSQVAITRASPTTVGLPVFINLYFCPSGCQQQMQKRLYTSPYIPYHYTIGVSATRHPTPIMSPVL